MKTQQSFVFFFQIKFPELFLLSLLNKLKIKNVFNDIIKEMIEEVINLHKINLVFFLLFFWVVFFFIDEFLGFPFPLFGWRQKISLFFLLHKNLNTFLFFQVSYFYVFTVLEDFLMKFLSPWNLKWIQ